MNPTAIVSAASASVIFVLLITIKFMYGEIREADKLNATQAASIAAYEAKEEFQLVIDEIQSESQEEIRNVILEMSDQTYESGQNAIEQAESLLFDTKISPVAAGDVVRDNRLNRLCALADYADPACSRLAKVFPDTDPGSSDDSRPRSPVDDPSSIPSP